MSKVSGSGRIPGHKLRPETSQAIMALKRELAAEEFIQGAQVTFDKVRVIEEPPTIDVLFDQMPPNPDDFESIRIWRYPVSEVKDE